MVGYVVNQFPTTKNTNKWPTRATRCSLNEHDEFPEFIAEIRGYSRIGGATIVPTQTRIVLIVEKNYVCIYIYTGIGHGRINSSEA